MNEQETVLLSEEEKEKRSNLFLKWYLAGIPSETIKKAAIDYLRYNSIKPWQFNIKLSLENGWGCEFQPSLTLHDEGYLTWMSGEKVVELFFSANADLVSLLYFEEEWADE